MRPNLPKVRVTDHGDIAVAATATTASLDTAGAKHAQIIIAMTHDGAGAAPDVCKIEESDDGSAWNDLEHFATADVAADLGGQIIPSGTRRILFDVDLKGVKRYIRTAVSPAGVSAQPIVVVENLFDMPEGPYDAATAGVQHFFRGERD